MKEAQDDVKRKVYEVIENILEYKIKLVIDKLDSVHYSYKSLM